MIPRLLEKYRSEIIPKMTKEYNLKNLHRVPRLRKIVVNMGVGEAVADSKVLDKTMEELSLICGQKSVICRAKKDIANFKIRKGVAVGCKVTLRRAIMYEFLDRLINVALPRIRDFRGISANSFDKQGNFSLGVSDQIIFPEIEYDKIQRVQGMNITIVTNSNSVEHNRGLLKLFGMPFQTQVTAQDNSA